MTSPPLWHFADLSAACSPTAVPPDHSKINSRSRVNGAGAFPRAKSGAARGPGLRPFALSEPARDTRNGFAHFVGRTGIAKANEPAAVKRIEIDAGGGRDASLLQHLFGKLETVGGEFGDVGVEIERTVGGQEFVEAGLRQAFDQDAPVLLVAALYFLHLVAAFERSRRRYPPHRRHRDRGSRLQALHPPPPQPRGS